MNKPIIYCDNQSITQIDIRVLEAMRPFFLQYYANPQSVYEMGSRSKEALENARTAVASLINAEVREIVFTSCGTESNNLALKGIAQALKGKGNHIIISQIEHFSITNSAKKLESEGFEIDYVGVDREGFINEAELKSLLRKDTILVSLQYANPEIGAIQNIKKLAGIVKENSTAVFHSDGVGAVGVLPIDVKQLPIDALSFSSSSIYGPRGAAALFVKKGCPLIPQIDGGVQEGRKRAGTENLPSIFGFGTTCTFLKDEIDINSLRTSKLRNTLITKLPTLIPHIYLNGPSNLNSRLPGNVNFSIEFVEGEALFLMLDAKGIIAASGSACAAKDLKLSQVLKAIGVDVAVAQGSLIFTLSKYNTDDEINYILEVLPQIVEQLRAMSPLYSYFQKTGKRKEAGPGTDFSDSHDHENENED
ncbi:MAG: cysteine desulfurase [Elusimicrobiota bacterium]|jgi:cysteine desulfurase|nr:cysteine desulfurase [Elusimicrobiota bacterium]